jgi:hypothetical protein
MFVQYKGDIIISLKCSLFSPWYSWKNTALNNNHSLRAFHSFSSRRCFFYTFYLVYIWHCRIKLFLRHLPNCPCSNFSRYVDLFQEISPRIAKQLLFQVKLHHLRRKCKNDNPGFFYEWNTCNEKPRCAPEYLDGKYKSLNIWIWKHWNNFMGNNCLHIQRISLGEIQTEK